MQAAHAEGAPRPGIVRFRPIRAEDVEAVHAIYAYHVTRGSGTFEETAPGVEEMEARIAAIEAARLPFLVADQKGQILAWAAARPYRDREAYRFTVEDAVYVAPGESGRGYGSALLSRVIEKSEAAGYRQMVAAIGDSRNANSIALHRKHGFEQIGVLKGVGFKFNRWLDVVLMQRELGSSPI